MNLNVYKIQSSSSKKAQPFRVWREEIYFWAPHRENTKKIEIIMIIANN